VQFFAYCPYCETKVGNATTILGGAQLCRALEKDADVEAIHLTADDGDHRWRLNREEKARLKKWLESGTFAH